MKRELSRRYQKIFDNFLESEFKSFIHNWKNITVIEAPSGHEGKRADYIKNFLSKLSGKIITGKTGSLFYEKGSGKDCILFDAHIDTVFKSGYSPKWIEKAGIVNSPGVGDNSVAVSSLLFLASWLEKQTYNKKIVLSFSTYEEKGDFLGIREALKLYPECLYYIVLEGHNLGRITTDAVGGAKVSFQIIGPGGHSWKSRKEVKSANHMLIAVLSNLMKKFKKNTEEFSYNFGILQGGSAANIISPNSYCEIDIRTLDDKKTDLYFSIIKNELKKQEKIFNLESKVLEFQKRPAGKIKKSSRIVKIVKSIQKKIGIKSFYLPSTTNANIPISEGKNSICIGIGKGGGIHSLSEWMNINSTKKGLLQLLYLIEEIT